VAHEVDADDRTVEPPGVVVAGATLVGERADADGALQPVDRLESLVVDQHDREGDALGDGGDDLGVQHQVGAVADEHDDLARRLRELDADARGDLVPHAGEAVLDVVALRVAAAPQLEQVAGHGARRVDDHGPAADRVVDDAHHLGLGDGPVARAQPPQVVDGGVPRVLEVGDLGAVGGARAGERRGRQRRRYARDRRLGRGQGGVQRPEARARVGDQRQRAELVRVERRDVQPHEADVRVLERRHRRRGEVRQPRPDREHQVGVARERVRRAAAVGAHGTEPFIGWSQGSAPLPAWVSTTGTPKRSANPPGRGWRPRR
jgi:hypothetical protein